MKSFTRKWKWLRFLNPFSWGALARRWKYGKDYELHISPELQSRYLRTLLTSISGLFLQSIRSVVTNASGAHKNIVKNGWRTTLDAFKITFSKKYEKNV